MALSITTRLVSDVVILDLSGPFWLHDISLRDHIQSLLESGSRAFVLNLSDVTFIESSGLGQLISMWTSVRNRGGRMTLLRPAAQVQKAITLTKLDTVFAIYQDETEAIEQAKTRTAN
jgi:anti-sigma B factor antagonist